MQPELFIFSAPVRSGKTTVLKEWLSDKKAGGFLTPDENNFRVLYDCLNETTHPFEASLDDAQEKSTAIGRYRFLTASFEKCAEILKNAIEQRVPLMVIDEIGPLELKGMGNDAALLSFFSQIQMTATPAKIIIVVRETLVEEVINRYHLKNVILINADFFKT
jgi:nucleoside-triphosphatase THEP1